METRANYALIGAFTLAVIVAAFGFVYWFSGGDRSQRRQPVRIVFSGPVSGLSKGSTVAFNGIRVGEVTDVGFAPEDPRRVFARIEIDRATPIRGDTRARLEVQMLSGVAQVALVGGEADAPLLTPPPGQTMATIYADRSDFQDIMETVRSLARRADEVLERVDRVVKDNEGAISRTMRNAERFSETLSGSSKDVETAVREAASLAEKLNRSADRVDGLLKAAEGFVGSGEGGKGGAFASVQQAADSLRALAGNLDKRTAELTASFTRLANSGLRDVQSAATDARRTLNDVSRTVRSVERNPQQFLFGDRPSIPEYKGGR